MPMNHHEAGILYHSCFLLALAYPLLATWLPDTFFDKIHRLSTSTILNKMGYHRNLPRCMVFAPKDFGRVGLCDLRHEMEAQQLIMLLQHLCIRTPVGNVIELLIHQYQLWAGLSQLILIDTSPCPWVPDKWLTHIWRTLNKHNIKIRHNVWLISPLRQHDVFLMEALNELGLTTLQLEQLNACHMFLQVMILAEMVDHTGTIILPQALKPPKSDMPQGLMSLSTSKLQWPWVHQPSPASWHLWNHTICNLFMGTTTSTKLHNSLREWTAHYQTIQTWKWHISLIGSLLHQVAPRITPRAVMRTTTQCTKLTFTLTIPTSQHFEGPPVMPYDTYNRMVPLPIPALP